MYLRARHTTSCVLRADDALLLAGLARAAELSGLRVVDHVEDATLSLRSAGAGAPHRHLDVNVWPERLVVAIDHQPSNATWSTILELLGHIAAARGTPTPAPPD